MGHKARIKEFSEVLQEPNINLKRLKQLSFNGIPDSQGQRALTWKLLLNYLPTDRTIWSTFLVEKRNIYKNLIDELIVRPDIEEFHSNDTDGSPTSPLDHPLNCNPDSQWRTYFRDNDVLLQIDKDVRRLCPDISFFQQPSEYPCRAIVGPGTDVARLHSRVQNKVLKCANVERRGLGVTKISLATKKATEDYAPMSEGAESHWEVVERILFLYAKLNPGQSYVQGMNEIVGPIYYTFASDPDVTFREYAEADCFFCFTNLMSEIRDFFIKTLDEADGGINNMMSRLLTQLQHSDIDIWLTFKQQDLKPQYYSFRWLTLLLSQEFALPDVLRIWDSLFSDEKRFDFLIHTCCAMIVILRNHLVNGDFPSNLKLLQNFPPMDVQIIITKAMEISRQKM